MDASVSLLGRRILLPQRSDPGIAHALRGLGAIVDEVALIDALEHQYAPFENNVYEPLAGIIHLATWRARAKEARLDDRAMAVTFPDSVGVVLDLDIDNVLQQDPFDWAAHT